MNHFDYQKLRKGKSLPVHPHSAGKKIKFIAKIMRSLTIQTGNPILRDPSDVAIFRAFALPCISLRIINAQRRTPRDQEYNAHRPCTKRHNLLLAGRYIHLHSL